MKYKVGIDARMIRHSGIGTYLQGLLCAFSRLKTLPGYSVFFPRNPPTFPGSAFSSTPFSAPIYSLQEQIEYAYLLDHCELWHAPHYNIPWWKRKTRLVVTIHDLIHWIFRSDFNPLQQFYAGQMFSRVVKIADHILCVSHKTKQDLIHYFSADSKKITVTYEGILPQFHRRPGYDGGRVLEKLKIRNPFFLYVGLMKRHKNVGWLIELFQAARARKKLQSQLVLVGKIDPKNKEVAALLKSLREDEGILHFPYLELEDLIGLYHTTLALVHPSLYEGFGLTLLEAMACGSPVLAFKAGSIPEIASPAAYLVDSGDSAAFLKALADLEASSSLRSDLTANGLIHAGKFSWDEMASQTERVYKQVLG